MCLLHHRLYNFVDTMKDNDTLIALSAVSLTTLWWAVHGQVIFFFAYIPRDPSSSPIFDDEMLYNLLEPMTANHKRVKPVALHPDVEQAGPREQAILE